ncbi:MAG: response regulator [Ignavibacteriales bacterium]
MEKQKTILIVDDEKTNREVLQNFLKKVFREPEYCYMEAENGDIALDIFTAEPEKIGLILTDFNMPFRGDQLAKGVRETGSKVPIIVVTFAFMPDYKEKGFDALVEKPISVGNLVRTIIKWTGFEASIRSV